MKEEKIKATFSIPLRHLAEAYGIETEDHAAGPILDVEVKIWRDKGGGWHAISDELPLDEEVWAPKNDAQAAVILMLKWLKSGPERRRR